VSLGETNKYCKVKCAIPHEQWRRRAHLPSLDHEPIGIMDERLFKKRCYSAEIVKVTPLKENAGIVP